MPVGLRPKCSSVFMPGVDKIDALLLSALNYFDETFPSYFLLLLETKFKKLRWLTCKTWKIYLFTVLRFYVLKQNKLRCHSYAIRYLQQYRATHNHKPKCL